MGALVCSRHARGPLVRLHLRLLCAALSGPSVSGVPRRPRPWLSILACGCGSTWPAAPAETLGCSGLVVSAARASVGRAPAALLTCRATPSAAWLLLTLAQGVPG